MRPAFAGKTTLAAVALSLFSTQTGSQPAQYLPMEPILRVDPEMHTAVIRRIGVDAKCDLIATGSEDKTIRLWAVPDGRLLNTLRVPIGPGNNGKIFAVALSPGGDWTAAGGWTRTGGDHWVYVFDNASGAIAARFGSFGQTINHLAISPDGTLLAAAFRIGGGIRVWKRKGKDLSSWEAAGWDPKYNNEEVTGAAFDSKNNLYTVASDRKVRRYPSGIWINPQSVFTVAGHVPYSVAVHPSGKDIAVGFTDSTAVEIYDAATLTRSKVLETASAKGKNLSAVSWSPDGTKLFAGGSFSKDGHRVIRQWPYGTAGEAIDIEGPTDLVFHMLPCGDGVALAAGDPAFGALDVGGKRVLWKERVTADMRGKLGNNFTVSTDGMKVRFGTGKDSENPVLFDLSKEELRPAPEPLPDLASADVTALPLTDWISSDAPKLSGAPLALDRIDKLERSQSLAIAPDKQSFVLGTDFNVRGYEAKGAQLWKQQAAGVAWGVNTAKNGELAIAALGDGTIRWYRMKDGKELLALFVHVPTRQWIAWTPKGYYTASAEAEKLIGWSVNRGWDKAPVFSPISKFHDTFYRPDIVARVLALLDEEKAISRRNELASLPHTGDDVSERLPPVVQIVTPRDRERVYAGEVEIGFTVLSPSGVPVKRAFATVDGVPVSGAEVRDLGAPRDAVFRSLKIKVPARDVSVSVLAETAAQTGKSTPLKLISLDPPQVSVVKPRLFAVVVGAGDYGPGVQKLPFSANDARDFATALQAQNSKVFRSVETHWLIDKEAGHEATKTNIEKEISWLWKSAKDPADDVMLFYFSGHGLSRSGVGTWLLAADYNGVEDDHDLTGIKKGWLFDTLHQSKAKIIFFIDACHAADGFDSIDFSHGGEANDIRALTYASSSRHQLSYGPQPGKGRNSYFTRALLEGLKGEARRGSREIRTNDLRNYIEDTVPSLALPDKQEPVIVPTGEWQHMPIAYASEP
jgi:WD40 repeat protein